MNVSIGERWEQFVDQCVKAGRYSSASEMIREGLRLVEEREARLQSLRDTLNASVANGRPVTEEHIDLAIKQRIIELKSKGVCE